MSAIRLTLIKTLIGLVNYIGATYVTVPWPLVVGVWNLRFKWMFALLFGWQCYVWAKRQAVVLLIIFQYVCIWGESSDFLGLELRHKHTFLLQRSVITVYIFHIAFKTKTVTRKSITSYMALSCTYLALISHIFPNDMLLMQFFFVNVDLCLSCQKEP